MLLLLHLNLIYFVSYSAEQTSGYAPPEAFLNVSWYKGPSTVTSKYVCFFISFLLFSIYFFSSMRWIINWTDLN